MRRNLIVFIASLFAATLLFAAKPPVTVKIDAAAKKQPAVTFPHEKHLKIAKTCDKCHHTQKGLTAEKDTKVEKCSTCHLDPKDPKVPSMREMSLAKNPFHIGCINCHKEQKKGPTTCVKCHVKAAAK
jgi:hypothetical protein